MLLTVLLEYHKDLCIYACQGRFTVCMSLNALLVCMCVHMHVLYTVGSCAPGCYRNNEYLVGANWNDLFCWIRVVHKCIGYREPFLKNRSMFMAVSGWLEYGMHKGYDLALILIHLSTSKFSFYYWLLVYRIIYPPMMRLLWFNFFGTFFAITYVTGPAKTGHVGT